MATIPMNNSTLQMSTPINSLPMKTTTDTLDISDDDDVQAVLKDFEKFQEPVQHIPTVQPIQEVHEPIVAPPPVMQELNFNDDRKTFVDFNIAKKSIVFVLLVALVYNTSMIEKLILYLPEYFKKHIHGREILIHLIILFVVFYSYEKYLSS